MFFILNGLMRGIKPKVLTFREDENNNNIK